MGDFRIQKQTEAEKDEYLVECFHDAGFIHQLVESNFSIITGRKGAGKTAIARYLEKKGSEHNIDLAYRISIRNISVNLTENIDERLNAILNFVTIKLIKKLLSENIFLEESGRYWNEFLLQNGLQQISDYETFVETQKTNKVGFSASGVISTFVTKLTGGVNTEADSTLTRATISKSPGALIESLRQSLPKDKRIFIFIDDISDHLDDIDDKDLRRDIALIKNLLLNFENYNASFSDNNQRFRLVSLLRDDIFEFMEGSNTNKLKSDALNLEWNEKSFAGLIVRRLPFFAHNVVEHLKDPVEAIRQQFPDEVFAKTLEQFETNHYKTNFYAYMVAISFNRPRDFLRFCFAMRERLSMKHPAEFENIESAEIEYSDYFMDELRDELFLASRMFSLNINQDRLNRLIDMLSTKNGFNSSQLKSDLGQYLGEKTSLGKKKIEWFIQELWRYGIVGFRRNQNEIIHFKYLANDFPLTLDKVKDYVFYLHRGLWWFTKKRKGVQEQRSEASIQR